MSSWGSRLRRAFSLHGLRVNFERPARHLTRLLAARLMQPLYADELERLERRES